MRIAILALGTAAATILSTHPAQAQSPTDIQNLVGKSKLIEAKHPITAKVSGGFCDIATYCDPKTSNQDLKITTLLMMKEISLRYKNIRKIRVNYYELINPKKSRTVWVTEADVMALDGGKSATEALFLLRVIRHGFSKSSPKKTKGGHKKSKTTAIQTI